MKWPHDQPPHHRTLGEQAGSCLVLWLCLSIAVGIITCAFGGIYLFWR